MATLDAINKAILWEFREALLKHQWDELLIPDDPDLENSSDQLNDIQQRALSGIYSKFGRRLADLALEDLLKDDMLSRSRTGTNFGDTTPRGWAYSLNLDGIKYVDRLIESGEIDPSEYDSQDQSSGDYDNLINQQSKGKINVQLANSNKDQIVNIFHECKIKIENSALTNEERSDRLGQINAAISLSETPNPIWEIVRQIASWLQKVAEVAESIMKVLRLMGVA